MATGTLVLLVLALVIIVLASNSFLGKRYVEANDMSLTAAACRGSVERNARLHIRGFEFPTTLNCPAQNIKITTADEQAKKIIADAMYYCWSQYGEGKLNLFSDEGTFCSVCAFIDIETDKPVTGLPDYLMSEQIPDKSGRYYHDYLASYRTSKAEDVLGEIKDTPLLNKLKQHELRGKSSHAIVFVYAKGVKEMEKIIRHITAQTTESQVGYEIGVFGGLATGAGAFATLATIGVASGPAGWIALGAGLTVVGVVQLGSFLLSADTPPEWASYIVLREWNAVDTGNILKEELGCTYFPTPLEQR